MAVFGSRAARASDARELGVPRPVVDVLRRLAQNKKAPPSQIALAWLLGQKPWIVPCPGTRRRDHVTQDLDSPNEARFPLRPNRSVSSDGQCASGNFTRTALVEELQQDGRQDFRGDIMGLALDHKTLGTRDDLAKLVRRWTHERHGP